MGLLLYNLLIHSALVLGAPLWLAWLALSPKVRAGFRTKFGWLPHSIRSQLANISSDLSVVWLHCVSVGEFNAVRPLITELAEEPIQLVISTTTLTGQTLAQQQSPESAVVLYFPFDFPWVVSKILKLIKPTLILLTETELWPNFIHQASQQAKVVLINGRLSPSSFKGYQYLRKLLMRPMLEKLQTLYMQSMGDADRMQILGAPKDRIIPIGNIKFDINPTIDAVKRDTLNTALGFKENDIVLIMASTHEGEEALAAELYQRLKAILTDLKLIIVPRHPERCPSVGKMLNNRALRYSLRTELSERNPNQAPIVLVDTIGELMPLYSLSDVAVVGGSFVPSGGHNLLEPISQNIPILFGPHMFNFPELTRLVLEQAAGIQVHSIDELEQALVSLCTQPTRHQHIVDNAARLLQNNRGVKDRLLVGLKPYWE